MSQRVSIRLLESGASFTAAPEQTLLQAAQQAGLSLPHSCTLGGCGSCRVHIHSGQVGYEEWPFGLSEEEAAQGQALACQARAQSDLVISVPAPSALSSEPARYEARIRHGGAVAPGIWQLQLDLADPAALAALRCQPGQYLNLILPDGRSRSFSLASAELSAGLQLHIRQIEGGAFTSGLLPGLRAGDVLTVELPLGSFVYRREDERPLLMVATGTGIAPVRSMLESLLDDPDCPPVSLYWGQRQAEELYLDAELRSWAERLYEFRYVPVLSRADAHWGGQRGHVQDAIAADWDDLSEHALYLCGSPAMIRDVKALATQRGADPGFVYADGFTFQC